MSVIKLDLELEDISISEPLISFRGPVGWAFERLIEQSRSCLEPLSAQRRQFRSMLKGLRNIYEDFQLRSLTAWVSLAPQLTMFDVEIELDDAAVRISPERFSRINEALGADGHDTQRVAEVEALRHGIVYIRYGSISASTP